jgi:hypothetical protein
MKDMLSILFCLSFIGCLLISLSFLLIPYMLYCGIQTFVFKVKDYFYNLFDLEF